MLEHQASRADWESALATVDSNLKAHAIDAEAAQRQRAVLETAIALERQATDPVGRDASTLVIRGGSWSCKGYRARSASRDGAGRSFSRDDCGCRVCLEA